MSMQTNALVPLIILTLAIINLGCHRENKYLPDSTTHMLNRYNDDPLLKLCLDPHATASQVEDLLAKGEKPDGNMSDAPPLSEAVLLGNVAVAQTLIQHRANTNALDRAKKTPIMYVSNNNPTQLATRHMSGYSGF